MSDALSKARQKSLAYHFKKEAARHESKAKAHENAAEAQKARAEVYAGRAEKAEGDQKSHLKNSASFHKSLAALDEKQAKFHKQAAEHMNTMQLAFEEADASKVYKMLGVEEEPLSTRPVTPETAPTPEGQPPVEKAAPAAGSTDINESIGKALDAKLTEAVNAAFERVLTSEDFSKKVDNAIASKLLEKLGSSTVPTEVRTVAVPRTQGTPAPQKAAPVVNVANLDPEVAELCKVD